MNGGEAKFICLKIGLCPGQSQQSKESDCGFRKHALIHWGRLSDLETLGEPIGPGASLGCKNLMEDQGPEARELQERVGSLARDWAATSL